MTTNEQRIDEQTTVDNDEQMMNDNEKQQMTTNEKPEGSEVGLFLFDFFLLTFFIYYNYGNITDRWRQEMTRAREGKGPIGKSFFFEFITFITY
jgi:hypothetical protein